MHPAYIRVAYGMDRCQCTVRVAYGLILHCTCRIWSGFALYVSHMERCYTVRVAYGLILHCFVLSHCCLLDRRVHLKGIVFTVG